VVAVQRMNACCPKKDPATASRPDLGERWPSRLVATAAENRLSTFRATLTRRCGSQRLPNNRTCTRAPPGAVRGSHPGTSNDRSEGERPQSWARQLKRIASQMPSGIVARNCFQLGGAGYAAARDQPESRPTPSMRRRSASLGSVKSDATRPEITTLVEFCALLPIFLGL
jgi:hypothetical protein